MTDLRDPDPRTIVREAETPARRTLMARALAPIRRAGSRNVATTDRNELQPASIGDFEVRPKRGINIILWSIVVVVLLPIASAGLYLFAFASDQYVAETRFAVRQVEVDSGSKGGSGSAGGTNTGGSVMSGSLNLGGEDAEIIASYIHSRAIIDDISRTVDIRAIFRRPEADLLARLPSDASQETLDTYWNRMVSVYIEASSGIVTVSASAFRREDALTLTRAILASSERLANSLSMKIRRDTMGAAEDEVRRAEGQVRFALSDMTAFRNKQHLIDPVKSSESSGRLLQQLLIDKIDAESKLFVAQRTQGPDAPGLASLKARLESVNNHVAEIKDQMAGDTESDKNMAATLASFEELELKRMFAERMYGFARDGVERARIAASRQMIYLAVFVQPSLPQDFTYPQRFTDFFLIAIAGILTWISGAIITASILDHRL